MRCCPNNQWGCGGMANHSPGNRGWVDGKLVRGACLQVGLKLPGGKNPENIPDAALVLRL